MREVTVKKEELREIVQKNRAGHHAQWEEAFAGYRTAIIAALEANLAAFKAGNVTRVTINEAPPEDHTEDYDRVLRMISMSVKDEITLDEESFTQFVMDDWNWKRAWNVSNAKYLSGGRR